MTGSAVGSPMLKARVPLVLDRPDETWFAIDLMHRDIGLALATAEELGIAVPSAEAADYALRSAEDLGYEHSDIAALYRTLAQLSPAIRRSASGVN